VKLDNKGYLIVEVIVATVLALVMAYFLIDITMEMKTKNDDAYHETIFLSDKALMTKQLMQDLNSLELNDISICSSGNYKCVDFIYDENLIKRMRIDINTKFFEYGTFENNAYKIDDYYSKKISDKLTVGEINISLEEENEDTFLTVKVPLTNIYFEKDYGINLMIRKSNIVEIEETT